MGDDAFWKGIRSYYQKYRNSNATVADFRREMEAAFGKDLTVFFDQWLFEPGTLKLNGTWRYDAAKKQIIVDLTQTQTDGRLFKMPIEVGIYYPGQTKPTIEKLQMDERSKSFTISTTAEPEKLVLDPNTWVLMDAELKKEN